MQWLLWWFWYCSKWYYCGWWCSDCWCWCCSWWCYSCWFAVVMTLCCAVAVCVLITFFSCPTVWVHQQQQKSNHRYNWCRAFQWSSVHCWRFWRRKNDNMRCLSPLGFRRSRWTYRDPPHGTPGSGGTIRSDWVWQSQSSSPCVVPQSTNWNEYISDLRKRTASKFLALGVFTNFQQYKNVNCSIFSPKRSAVKVNMVTHPLNMIGWIKPHVTVYPHRSSTTL